MVLKQQQQQQLREKGSPILFGENKRKLKLINNCDIDRNPSKSQSAAPPLVPLPETGLLSSSSTSSYQEFWASDWTRPVRGKIQKLCHIQWPKQTKSHSVLVLHICRDIMKHRPTHWVVHRGMSVCTFTLICSCTCKHHECTLWFGSYDTPLSHQLLCCMFDAAVRPLWFSASGLTTGRANEVHSNLLYWFLSVGRTQL